MPPQNIRVSGRNRRSGEGIVGGHVLVAVIRRPRKFVELASTMQLSVPIPQ